MWISRVEGSPLKTCKMAELELSVHLHVIMFSSHINTLIDIHLLFNSFSQSVSQSISQSDSQPVHCYRDRRILYD